MIKDDRPAQAVPRQPVLAPLVTVTRVTAGTVLMVAGPVAFYVGMLLTGTLFAAAGGFRWWIWPVAAASVWTWIALAGELLYGMGVPRRRLRWMSVEASIWAAGPWLALVVCFQIYGWPG